MFAPRSIATALSGGGRYALDVPVAALAGLSVAFLAFAAPDDLLADLVRSLNLAAIIPGAEPPLGFKARLGLGAAAAIAVFAVSFFLLRWLDRLGVPTESWDEPAADSGAPRLRRRDSHPDAPPRPPLLATVEVGEPEEPQPRRRSLLAEKPVRETPLAAPEPAEPVVEPGEPEAPPARRRSLLTGVTAREVAEPVWTPAPDETVEDLPIVEPAPEPPVLDLPAEAILPPIAPAPQRPQPAEQDFSAAHAPGDPVAPAPSTPREPERPFPSSREPDLPEPPSFTPPPVGEPAFPSSREPIDLDEPPSFTPPPAAEPAPPRSREPIHLHAPQSCAPSSARGEERPPVAAPRPVIPPVDAAQAPSRPARAETIAELMARLEQGLARRRGPLSRPGQEQPAPPPSAADDRLQSAIESLQRLAARQQ